MVLYNLKQNLKFLEEALKKQNECLRIDENKLKEFYIELAIEFESVEKMVNQKKEIEEEKIKMAKRFNESMPEIIKKIEANLEQGDFEKFVKNLINPFEDAANDFKYSSDILKKEKDVKMEFEMADIDKKAEFLPKWKEVKELYDERYNFAAELVLEKDKLEDCNTPEELINYLNKTNNESSEEEFAAIEPIQHHHTKSKKKKFLNKIFS